MFKDCGLQYNQKYTIVGLFGFITLRMTNNWERKLQKTVDIDYAGNLAKAKFLVEARKHLKINLYGSDENNEFGSKGLFDHQAIPHVLEGHFGLVWDSETYPEMTGIFGDYEKYNSPFKASMYLAADQPIIVSKTSAVAPYVIKQGIGIVIDSLDQLPDIFDKLTPDEYKEMVINAKRIGELMRQMYNVKRAAFDMIDKVILDM
ncbi:hypothetical protein H9L19_05285 [Weissella diestrammenae]|uniref:Glucosyltransferase 3-like C-terminal domain-containing protein n=2 Tax=Weissella diestrammenae TaxID=1162633 RepID=A0A7G9T3Z7_9LACO|nr:hypothetical protein [Weissella diestrammenae]QNN74822.1 hypothetical protein H9L19_05285 [Weissella diestrammenae]